MRADLRAPLEPVPYSSPYGDGITYGEREPLAPPCNAPRRRGGRRRGSRRGAARCTRMVSNSCRRAGRGRARRTAGGPRRRSRLARFGSCAPHSSPMVARVAQPHRSRVPPSPAHHAPLSPHTPPHTLPRHNTFLHARRRGQLHGRLHGRLSGRVVDSMASTPTRAAACSTDCGRLGSILARPRRPAQAAVTAAPWQRLGRARGGGDA